MWRQAEHHNPRRVTVEPMHEKRRGKSDLHPRDETIRQMLTLTRHRQETRRFVHHEQFVILMDHVERALRRGIVRREGHTARFSANGAARQPDVSLA